LRVALERLQGVVLTQKRAKLSPTLVPGIQVDRQGWSVFAVVVGGTHVGPSGPPGPFRLFAPHRNDRYRHLFDRAAWSNHQTRTQSNLPVSRRLARAISMAGPGCAGDVRLVGNLEGLA
jgi:hypothetical protein